jgi:ABC-type multidrug transport system fused ATPase/permease subunit
MPTRILFLDHGHIIEDGTHDSLLAAGGRYAQFWNTRESAAEWHLNEPD